LYVQITTKRKPMIEIIIMALGLDSLLQVHPRELGVIRLVNDDRTGEYRKDFL
jgi:hypothetical protein